MTDVLDDQKLVIDVTEQSACFYCNSHLRAAFPVSTALKGVGQRLDSFQTPVGAHVVYKKIGQGEPVGMVFVARCPIGKVFDSRYSAKLDEDLILTRILWLSGCDLNNAFYPNSTRDRFIYIHGTADAAMMGQLMSKGCVRMKNNDILALFALIREGSWVMIRVSGHI